VEYKKVGIVGCGQMGTGIALVCAQAGIEVKVRDIEEQYLKKGHSLIESYFRKSVEKGKMTEGEKGRVMERLSFTTELEELAGSDLIIEAVPERLELKRAVFEELDKIIPVERVLATNTSDLPIIEIAMATKRPEKVVGAHFFNPPTYMKLVEVARTIATSEESVEIVCGFVKKIGKEPVVAKDTPGFIVNRLGTPFMLEAIRMV